MWVMTAGHVDSRGKVTNPGKHFQKLMHTARLVYFVKLFRMVRTKTPDCLGMSRTIRHDDVPEGENPFHSFGSCQSPC